MVILRGEADQALEVDREDSVMVKDEKETWVGVVMCQIPAGDIMRWHITKMELPFERILWLIRVLALGRLFLWTRRIGCLLILELNEG
jgi:hypothetical protein